MPIPPVLDADAPSGSIRVRASLPMGEGRSRGAAALSFLLHAVLIALAIRLTAVVVMPKESPIGNAIQFVLQGGGGGGGSGGHAFVASKPPPPTAVAPPVVPEPVPEVAPVVIPPPLPAPSAPPKDTSSAPATAVAGAGTGGGTGGGTGTGTGTGTGSGVGPGSGSGTGGGNGGGRGGFPPETKQLILPQDPPKSLKGKTYEVTLWVDSVGQVTNLAVDPQIKDKKYAQKFDEVMRAFRFTPARDANGKHIAGMLVVAVTF